MDKQVHHLVADEIKNFKEIIKEHPGDASPFIHSNNGDVIEKIIDGIHVINYFLSINN